MESKIFVNQLIRWYRHQKRDLPWRHTKNPYKIWLSEIMLQQTRVKQAMPYYLKFIAHFPTVRELAHAPESEVLRLWQGLGYYSRARNLHACAKTVTEELEGKFPETFEELLKLKGIGRYTAAAIASLAFDKPNAVVDGNVYRVLSRVFGLEHDIALTKSAVVFEQKANELITRDNPGEFNQAIMDFGAIQCTPRNPSCAICPVNNICFAFNNGRQHSLPVKSKKVKTKNRFFAYFIFECNGKVLMKQRAGKDVWQGLYDFYLEESTHQKSETEILGFLTSRRNLMVQSISTEIKHILTHQRIFTRFVRIEVLSLSNFEALAKEKTLQAFEMNEVQALPKPVLIDNYLKKHFIQ